MKANGQVEIVEGIDERYVEEALRLSYEAFAKKFCIGFRDAAGFVRLFRDSIDTTSCLSALAEGDLLGTLTFQTAGQEFYHLKLGAVFTRFWPLRAIRVLLNLALLADSAGPDEFIVDSLAVDPASRGRGIGTALMERAEERARSMGKATVSLGVIGENVGAIRLYERLGFERTRTWRGRWLRIAFGTEEVHRMEKALSSVRPGETSQHRLP